MRCNIHLTFWCFLLLSQGSLGQSRNSAFYRAHSLNRPDSILIKDTVLFPTYTVFSNACYIKTTEKLHWADSGSVTYKAQCHVDSGYLTLRADSAFIFLSNRGPRQALSVGRWWLVKDSLVCLNWIGVLSLDMAKRERYDGRRNRFSNSSFSYLPIRIDHWWFIRRGSQLVPY